MIKPNKLSTRLNCTISIIKSMLTAALLLCTFITLDAQTGTPPITGFSPKEYNGSSDIGLLYQIKRGFFYIGGSGQYILEYDGVSWKRIPVNCNIPDVIVEDDKGNLFVSDFNSMKITLLKPDHTTGQWISQPVKVETPDSFVTNDIYSYVKNIDNKIYIAIDNTNNQYDVPLIYKYDGESFKPLEIKSTKTLISHHLINKKGIVLLEDSSYWYDISTLKKDYLKINKSLLSSIYSIVEYSPNEIVLVTYESELWKYNLENHKLEIFGPPETEQRLKGVRLLNLRPMRNGNWVLSTIGSGLFILDNDGKIIRNINSKDGINSDIILRTFQDNVNQLWIGHFSGGINRINVSAPVDIWNKKNGIEGASVSSITNFKNLYIAKTVTHIVYFDAKTNNWKPLHKNIDEGFYMLTKLTLSDKKEHLFMGGYFFLYEINKSNANQIETIDKIKLPQNFGLVQGIANQPDNLGKIYIWSDNNIACLLYGSKTVKTINSFKDKNIDYKKIEKLDNTIWTFDAITQRPIKLDMFAETAHTFAFDSADIDYIDSAVQIMNKTKDSVFTVMPDNTVSYNPKLSKITSKYSGMDISMMSMGERALCIRKKDASFFSNIFIKNKEGEYKRNFLLEQILNKYQINSFYTDEKNNNTVWVATTEGVLKIQMPTEEVKDNENIVDFQCYIRQIQLGSGSVIFHGNFTTLNNNSEYEIIPQQKAEELLELEYDNNSISFKVAAPFLIEEEQMKYAFFLEGHDKNWYKTNIPVREYLQLPIGKYTLKVKAINYLGQESKEAIYKFRILPPWYRTWLAYIIYILLSIGLVFWLLKLYTRNLIKKNEYLETLVNERTEEISHANNVLQEQNDEIISQRDLLDERNQKIDAQNKHILASINYAANIQSALLPFENRIKSYISNYFILYKPKDIISGDFYWIEKLKDKIIIAIADCTGHGVPGALMSILGSNGINDAVFQKNILEPELILEHLHYYIFTALRQKETQNSDGMDIAITIWDKSKNIIQYAGAGRPLYIVKNNQIEQIKGDRMGIGGHYQKKDRKYTRHTMSIDSNTILYMSSDGFQDQIGGPKNRKFMKGRFRQLLLEISSLPIDMQKRIVEKRFNEWKNNQMQIDDVLVFGMKFE